MTNEEFAKQIAKCYLPPTTITESDVRVMMENSALQMADWKDSQHDYKINKVHEEVFNWIKANCRTEISVVDCTNMVRWIFKTLKNKSE